MPAPIPGIGIEDRTEELRHAHHVEWVNRLPQFDDVHWEIFDRGFISAVRFDSPDAYFDTAGEVFAAAPIRECGSTSSAGRTRYDWPNRDHLRHVRVLDLNDGNRIANQRGRRR